MRRLVLSNSYTVELDTFKNVLCNPTTARPDDETSFFQELPNAPSYSFFTDSLTAARLSKFEKRKRPKVEQLPKDLVLQKNLEMLY